MVLMMQENLLINMLKENTKDQTNHNVVKSSDSKKNSSKVMEIEQEQEIIRTNILATTKQLRLYIKLENKSIR